MSDLTVAHTLGVVAGDTLSSGVVEALLTAGFPSADLVDVAAALFGNYHRAHGAGGFVNFKQDHSLFYVGRYNPTPEGPLFTVDVTAGVIRLRGRDLARAERRQTALDDLVPMVSDQRHLPARQVQEWSARSRSNLILKVASADWRPLLAAGVPVMATLTYPEHWDLLAFNGKQAKKHLERLKHRFRRQFGQALGLWKLEFQRRGAPHFHILLPLPAGMSLRLFRSWLAFNWSACVFADVSRAISEGFDGLEWVAGDWAKHLRAGTAVDLREGLRCRDPKRIAVYFLKHSSKSTDGKEYQHIVPPEWSGRGDGPGRFWGFWGIEMPTGTAYLSATDFLSLRRVLRRYAAANGRKVGRSGRFSGCWVAVNDGPRLGVALAQYLAMNGGGDPELGPPLPGGFARWVRSR